MTIETSLLRWIVLLPLLGVALCAVGSLAGRRELARLAAPLVVLLAFAVSLAAVARLWGEAEGAALADRVYSWMPVGPLQVEVAFRVDALASVMILIVTGVGLLIHVYSLGYMHDDADEARFFAYLNLFMASMLILVLGDSLPLLFVGWEGVGLCSYLLIGFWYANREYADAGRKAFVANRVGDAAFLVGLFVLFWTMADAGKPSLSFTDVNGMAGQLAQRSPAVVTAVCLLLLAGATGKSAQIPLYVWLPDAMAGPTPVSALIHAATMVTAGVYMIARLSPLYVHSPGALEVIVWIGALTSFFAATIAIAQRDLKKILAYSTISQLGYMFLALGAGAFAAGIFHVMTHAFFKALLFLGAGSVMHALSGELDVYRMGGLKEKLPLTRLTFLIGTMAIAGVPLLAAFFSKDMILEAAFAGGHLLPWALGVVTAGLTAFYMFRAYFLAFEGESRVARERQHHLHESPATMTAPLVILAALSVTGGYVGLPHGILWGDAFGRYLAPSLGALHGEEHHLAAGTVSLLMLAATVVALGGILVAYAIYLRAPGSADAIAERARGLYRILWNKYYVDELYDAVVLTPFVALSNVCWKVIDNVLVDGLVNGLGAAITFTGGALRMLQTGNVQSYALATLMGAICLLLVYASV
jgi:NADH-quinone oxidoreductase subunit L